MVGTTRGASQVADTAETNCKDLKDDLDNKITPIIEENVGKGTTRAVGEYKDENNNITKLCGTSASYKARGKAINLGDYELAIGPAETDYQCSDTKPKRVLEGLTLCENVKNFRPNPRKTSVKAQNRCSHAELAIIFHLAQKNKLRPRTSLKLKIAWPNNGPYPCPFCAKMLCAVVNECHVNIIICNDDNVEQEPFKNEDDCNDLDKIFKTPDVTLSKCQVYKKILDNIAAS